MPFTRPGMIEVDGVCGACINYEKRKNVDYTARFEELRKLTAVHRSQHHGDHDCIIAVSGGKDSHFQVHMFKEILGMNPLLVTVEDNFPMTEAGKHNIKNISEEFGCDIVSMKPNIAMQKRLMRYMFEKYGKPTYIVDRYIYTFPLHIAKKFGIELIVYGENIEYEYGTSNKETWDARNQINNGVASGFPLEELYRLGCSPKELIFHEPPKGFEDLFPIFLSYFVPWSSHEHYEFAKARGFHDLEHEWNRRHHVENYNQVDSRAYLVHPWMKYPKFGHATATDMVSRQVRYGLVTREEALDLVKKHDAFLDSQCVRDFCTFCGYHESDFWRIVDKHYNPDLFQRTKNGWELK
jgi:N-acetyl sugar amidotransferase